MKRLILITALFFISAVYCGAADKVITAAGDPWPPFTDPSAPEEGLSLEIIRAAYATQGYTVKMEYLPWARAKDGVKKGKYDILAGVWMTDKRKADFLFSVPYTVNQIKFIKRVDDPFEYNGLESLAGKKIGTVRGYGYGDDFLNATHFKREVANDFITNIKKLTNANPRIDLAIEDEIVGRVTIANEASDLLSKIRFTENALSTSDLHIASGLANPRHKEFIAAFDKGLAEIKSNGTYARILGKFGL
ncbi:MAG: transporter substrate-binding domain-containing protein [Desulfobacterium sp.]|nr:transporter substrate-binding domain-containing protein [Desulfobacterium sp.]